MCLLGTFDVTLFRYFPWLHSQFSVETKGYPSPFVFGLCVSSKLLQSLFTISCQIVVLVGSSRDASFLIVNVTVTVLIFLVNAVEAVLWSGFMQEWQTAGAKSESAMSSGVGLGFGGTGGARSLEMLDTAGRTAESNPVLALAGSKGSNAVTVDPIPEPSLPRTSLSMPLGYDLEAEERVAGEAGAVGAAASGSRWNSRLS